MINLLLEKLVRGEKPIGIFTVLGGTANIESAAMAGIDYVILDNEHGPHEPESDIPAVIAAERHGITPLIRPHGHDRASVLKSLDNGAQGLVVPYVRSLEEVLILLGRVKYKPIGDRGFGVVRANGFGFSDVMQDLEKYFEHMNEQTLFLPQCETAGFLRDVEDIVQLPGVDGVFVGPYDLSIALGVPGDLESKTLMNAVEKVQKVCADAGKWSFIYAGSPEKAKQFFDMGYDSVAAGVDAMLLTLGIAGVVKALR
jgi:4-hydroxy-2-oxoheptanedioate aldolase